MTRIDPAARHGAGSGRTRAQGDFGPVDMWLDRRTPGVLRVEIRGVGGDAEAAYRRWRYNFAVAKSAGIDKLLVVLELSGPVISEDQLSAMVSRIAELDVGDVRVALVEMRHERQNRDEVGILAAMEHGIAARVFPDEASATVWLRHGAS